MQVSNKIPKSLESFDSIKTITREFLDNDSKKYGTIITQLTSTNLTLPFKRVITVSYSILLSGKVIKNIDIVYLSEDRQDFIYLGRLWTNLEKMNTDLTNELLTTLQTTQWSKK